MLLFSTSTRGTISGSGSGSGWVGLVSMKLLVVLLRRIAMDG